MRGLPLRCRAGGFPAAFFVGLVGGQAVERFFDSGGASYELLRFESASSRFDPPTLDGEHGTRRHIIGVAAKNLFQQVDARLGWHIRQPYQARVACTAMDKLPEVRVDGDQNPALAGCHPDDGLVTWIWPQPRYLDHVVFLRPQPLRQPVTGTTIDEEFHLAI